MANYIEAEDLEVGNIVFVDKEHWYCTVIDVRFNLNNEVVVTFEPCDLALRLSNFTRFYKPNKKLKEYD